MFCRSCGKEIMDEAVICPACGCMVENSKAKNVVSSTGEQGNKAQISIILGIIGIVFAWILALVGHITSIIGIIAGIKEYKEMNKMSGLVLSIIGEVCSIISSIIGAVTVTSMLM